MNGFLCQKKHMVKKISILLSVAFTISCNHGKYEQNKKEEIMGYQMVKKENAMLINVAPQFKIIEYGSLGGGLTNGTVAVITSRYPEKGWGKNKVCDEIVYVISGSGFLEMPDKKEPLSEGDVAFVKKGQKIAWNGDNLKVFIPCIPAWTNKQHELIE